jgi:hypothetical protein
MKTLKTTKITSLLLLALSSGVALAGPSTGEQLAQKIKDNLLAVLQNCTGTGTANNYECRPTQVQVCKLFMPGQTDEQVAANECVTGGYFSTFYVDFTVTDSNATSGTVKFHLGGHDPILVDYDPNNLTADLNLAEIRSGLAAVVGSGNASVYENIPSAGKIRLSLQKGAQAMVKFQVTQGFDFSVTGDNGLLRLKLDTDSEVILGSGASNRTDFGFKLKNAIIQQPASANVPAQKLVADLLSFSLAVNEADSRFEIYNIGATNATIFKDGLAYIDLTSNGVTNGKIYLSNPGTKSSKIEFANTTNISLVVSPTPTPTGTETPLPLTLGTYKASLPEGTYSLSADAGTFAMRPRQQ